MKFVFVETKNNLIWVWVWRNIEEFLELPSYLSSKKQRRTILLGTYILQIWAWRNNTSLYLKKHRWNIRRNLSNTNLISIKQRIAIRSLLEVWVRWKSIISNLLEVWVRWILRWGKRLPPKLLRSRCAEEECEAVSLCLKENWNF